MKMSSVLPFIIFEYPKAHKGNYKFNGKNEENDGVENDLDEEHEVLPEYEVAGTNNTQQHQGKKYQNF
jgi:hypothetical protein